MAQLYAKKRSDGNPKAIECNDAGELYFYQDSPYALLTAKVDFITLGDNEIIEAPGAGKKLRIYKIALIVDFGVNTKLKYKSGSNDLSGAMQVDALIDSFAGGLHLDCNENEAFVINSSSPGQVSGYILYREVDV